MKNTIFLSLKHVVLTFTFLFLMPALILATDNVAYASEAVEMNGVTYTCYSTDDWEETDYDSFDEWYEYEFSNDDINNTILSHFKTYGGVCSASYVVTTKNKTTKSLTIENTVNTYPVVSLRTWTESDDDTLDYNKTITTLHLPANLVQFDPSKWRGVKTLTIDGNNPYYSAQGGALYNKKKTELIDCLNVTTLNLPSTVKTLPSSFPETLKAINVNKNNKKYSSKDGVLYNKKKTQILHYPAGKKNKTYKMPNTVKTLPIGFMNNHKYIEKIVLSNKIKTIPTYSFCDLKKLKSVTMPKKLQKIEGYCFDNCPKLKSVSLPSTCHTLDRSFDNCKSLKTITIKSKRINFDLDFSHIAKYTLVVKKGAIIDIAYNDFKGMSCMKTSVLSFKETKDDHYTAKALKTGTATLKYDNGTRKLKIKVVK